MTFYKLYKKILVLFLFSFSSLAFSNSFQDLQQIRIGAKNFLEQKISYKQSQNESQILISSIDERLKLKKCQTPLAFEIYGKQELKGRITLKASCSSENWFLYLGAQIKDFVKVVIAAQSIPRNTYLMPKHLKLIEKDIGSIHQGYYTNIKSLIGAKTTRSIKGGSLLSPYSIKLQQLVTKGDKVSIVAKTSSLEVKMPGIALQSGNLGQQVKVKNSRSGREIQAVVTGKYQVSVDF